MMLYNENVALANVAGAVTSVELRTMFGARCMLIRGEDASVTPMQAPHVADGEAARLLLAQEDGVELAAVVFLDAPNTVGPDEPATLEEVVTSGDSPIVLLQSHAALWEQLERTTEILREFGAAGQLGADGIRMLSLNRSLLDVTRRVFGAPKLPNNQAEFLSDAGWLGQNERRDRRRMLGRWLRWIGVALVGIGCLWALMQCTGCASQAGRNVAAPDSWIRTRWLQQEAREVQDAQKGVVWAPMPAKPPGQ